MEAAEPALVALQAGYDPPELRLDRFRPAWHRKAACRGMGTDRWFPERGADSRPGRAVCAGCPVKNECLDAGMVGAEAGLWGGTSAGQRAAMRRGVA